MVARILVVGLALVALAVPSIATEAVARIDQLFAIDTVSWLREAEMTEEFYQTFDGRVPAPLWAELAALRYRLQRA